MSKKDEALKLAMNKAFQLGQRYWSWADSEYSSHWKKADAAKSEFDQLVQDTIDAALAEQDDPDLQDKAPELVEQHYKQVVDGVQALFDAKRKQPAQQEQVRVPVTDNTYNYAKSLAEAIFKQHFASDEHYASGRIVWGVNDTVIGILTQIDNMVADMVRRPAQQQEPVAWVLVDGELSYPDEIDWETLQEQGHEVELLYTSPPASKPWVGLSTSDLDEIDAPIRERGSATIAEIYRAIEAKLREKNA